jgi:cytochrome c oxidase subunit 1
VLPVFSHKPLFGYPVVVFSGAAIGFMGWGVWAHHMFASGLGPISVAVFSVTTMFIAVPTGVKIINWIGTMWGGKLTFTTAMLFAIGLVTQFTIGGLSGVTHAVSPSDTQQTDTYWIVAHFHYVLFGGAVFGLFSGFYYWWPKVFGRVLDEKLGKWNFWVMVVGMNLTFGPMHIVGLQGQPRRMYNYQAGYGFTFWNLLETIGSFILAVGILLFIINAVKTNRKPANAPLDPWDARSLEWLTSSPPKEHNFDRLPTVHSLDEFFHRKYSENHETGEITQVATAEQLLAVEEANADTNLHMPSPSYWPMVLAFGLPVVALGVIYHTYVLAAVGALITIAGSYGWANEPSVAEPDDFDPPAAGTSSKELAPLG